MRKSKKVGTDETKYFIWSNGNMVYEFTATDDTTYFFGLHLVSSDDYKYVLNAHGDVVALVNASGIVTKRYEYDAFGVELNPDETDTNPYRYCAEYFDIESGTIYLRARYYSPNHGRFTQLDPARDGLNWYAYCYNNPVTFIDPSGEMAAAVAAFAVIDVATGYVIATAATFAIATAIALGCEFATMIMEIADIGSDDKSVEIPNSGGDNREKDSDYEKAKEKGDKADNHKDVKQNSRGNRSLPAEGTPNSSVDLVEPDGEIKQRRYYGPDGKAEKDIDYKHGGDHKFPHEHNWDWQSGGNPRGGHN